MTTPPWQRMNPDIDAASVHALVERVVGRHMQRCGDVDRDRAAGEATIAFFRWASRERLHNWEAALTLVAKRKALSVVKSPGSALETLEVEDTPDTRTHAEDGLWHDALDCLNLALMFLRRTTPACVPILERLARGEATQHVARDLGMKPNTVSQRAKRCIAKLRGHVPNSPRLARCRETWLRWEEATA